MLLTRFIYFLACNMQPPLLAYSALVDQSNRNAAVETIYEFPNETWTENLVVRGNGKILVTLISAPEVWQIDPESRTVELIYRFPNASDATGIAEVSDDVFAVAIGNWFIETAAGTPGSWSVWKIDMRGGSQQP